MVGFSSGEKPGLHSDVQPPPAEQGLVPESQGPAVANAVLAGGLGLYAERLVPYQPGADLSLIHIFKPVTVTL